jgi:hypothetical protein
MKLLTRLALMLAFALPLHAQTHALPAPDTNSPRTDNQNFRGRVSFGGPWPYYDATSYGASGSGQITTGSCNGTTTVRLAKALDFQNGQGIALYGCGPLPSISAPTITSVVQSTNIPPINYIYSASAYPNDPIQGATCSGTTATITTRGFHGLVAGESITVIGVGLSAYNVGPVAILTAPNAYQITYAIASCPGSSYGGTITLNAGSHTYSYEVASIDANNAVTAVSSASSVSSANVLSYTVRNTVAISHASGATMYAVYRKLDSGSYACVGTMEQVNQTSNGVVPVYVDYGGVVNSCAPNVPSSPPSSGVNGVLISAISSGAGTTSLTLATSASATASGVTVEHDDTAAINAAWLAASKNGLTYLPWGSGGAQVVLPLGTYYVQNLQFPTPNPSVGGTMQMLIYGQILNRQPIVSYGNYEFTGVAGAGAEAGGQKPKVSIGLPGVAPEWDIFSGTGAILENLSFQYCAADCIRVDTNNAGGPAIITLNNVYGYTLGANSGAAFHCTANRNNPGNPYGLYFNGGVYGNGGRVGAPSILFEGCSIIRGNNVTMNSGGIELRNFPSSVTYTGSLYWIGGITEEVPGPFITMVPESTNRISDIRVEQVVLADPPTGGDNTVVRNAGTAGNVSDVTISDMTPNGNGSSWTLMWEGGILDLQIPDCAYPSGICTGTLLFPPSYATTSSGRFTDYTGAQWYFGNPYGASPILHLVAAGNNTANLLQCENPLGTVLCSLDPNGNFAGASSSAAKYRTATNCTSSASPAVCGPAAAGAVTIAAGSSSVVVHTTAVTANSDISLTFNSALGARLRVTCNTTAQQLIVSAINPGTSFTISVPSNFTTNPGCMTYDIKN